jgi:beta-lactamase class A
MSSVEAVASSLHTRLDDVAGGLPDGVLGVAVYDYLSGLEFARDGSRWFHAASTIKIAILVAVFDAVAEGRFTLDHRLHVRNRFRSAVDGQPFRVQASRDADGDVHAAIGRTMRIGDLARHMITTSSNLATNLLLDLVGVDDARASLERRNLSGIDLRRGVEDDRAFEAGCNNRITPAGAIQLLRAIRDGAGFADGASDAMLDLLFDQQFSGGIGPGLPDAVRSVARVAHKTGDISAVSHDVGLVFLPSRPPYAIAILTESSGDAADRTSALVAASRAAYDAVAAAGETTCR